MPPTVSSQSSGPQSPRAAFNPRKGLLLVVIVILALASGLYIHDKSGNKTKLSASQPYAFSYKSLHGYKLAGPSAGNGLSFDVPKELSTATASLPGGSQIDFEQQAKNGQNPSVVTAELAAAAIPSGSDFSAYTLKTLNSNMTSAVGSPAYKTATSSLKQFVTQRLNLGLNPTLGTATALKTANINANAWQLALKAPPKTGSNAAGLPTVQGTAILAAGKSTFYYFFAYSVDYNWTGNQSAWQQVINSLKIDQ